MRCFMVTPLEVHHVNGVGWYEEAARTARDLAP